jgi:hypothetical protein
MYYDDDGATYDYERGAFFEQVMSARDRGSESDFSIAEERGYFAPPLRNYICRIHGRAGTGVTVNGQPATAYGGYDALLAAPTEGWAAGSDKYGPVTYVKVVSRGAKDIVVFGAEP